MDPIEAGTKIIEAATLGIYLPIIVMSAWAVKSFAMRLLWPALRDGASLRGYWLGIGAACAVGSHLIENVFYGLGRWAGNGDVLTGWLPIVLLMKVLILFGCGFMLAASVFGRRSNPLATAARLAITLWIGGAFLAAAFAG